MTTTYFDKDPWTLWWQGMIAAVVIVAAAALVFPQAVYEGFIWKYFWGPVVADGLGYNCVAYAGGAEVHCDLAGPDDGPTATPGYTTVSTVSYAVVLLAFLVGVYLGVERFDIEATNALFFAFVPFVFLGGTLRAVEDAIILLPADAGAFVVSFPTTALLISPLIYFLVFFVAAAVLAGGVVLARRGVTETYEWSVAITGTVLLVAAIAYLLYLVTLLPEWTLSVPMFVVTLVGATASTAVVWWAAVRYVPSINSGTGAIGPMIVWGHAIDGFANVLSLDWGDTLGLGRSYDPKHVVNDAIGDITEAVQPETLSDMIGTVWPFIPVKLGVALAVVYLFNDELREDSPRFFMLLLVAVLAVGLGPGTRDLLRAMFGI